MTQWLRRTTRATFYARDGASLDGARCAWCNRLTLDPTIDHLVPLSLGGTNDPDNLVTSCRRCNEQRGAQSWLDWADSCNVDLAVYARVQRLRLTPLTRALRLEGLALIREAAWYGTNASRPVRGRTAYGRG